MSESVLSNKGFYIILTIIGGFITLYVLIRTDGLNFDIPVPDFSEGSPSHNFSLGKYYLGSNYKNKTNSTFSNNSSSTSSTELVDISPTVSSTTLKPITRNSITDRSFYSTNKTITPPAVLLRPKGGTGNQLFQYSCHYAIAKRNNWPLYIMGPNDYKNNIESRQWGLLNRDFVLDQFHIPLGDWNLADDSWSVVEAEAITDTRMLSGDYPSNKVIQQSGGDYCQSESFFSSYRDELLEYFVQDIDLSSIKEWVEKVDSFESVAVHVRRGDFVRINVSVPLSYHRKCMESIVRRLEGRAVAFFVFSDDVEYVEKHLFPDDNLFSQQFPIYLVTDEKKTTSIQELFIMSRCKHQIIPDSTFSWWGAYFNKNPDKIVYASHFRQSTVESIYGDRKDFFVWLYKHIYYPIGWNVIEPDWESKDFI